MRPMSRKNGGFTLIELLTVLTIIGVLVGLLLPAVQASREASRRVECQNKVRQVALAAINLESVLKRFPTSRERNPFIHWHRTLLPNLEQQPLYDQISESLLRSQWFNLEEIRLPVSIYQCPSSPTFGMLHETSYSGVKIATTHYIGVTGRAESTEDGMFLPWDGGSKPRGRRFRDVTDGSSNTFLIGERPVNYRPLLGAWLGSQEYGHDAIGVNEFVPLTYYIAPGVVDGRNCPESKFGPGSLTDPCSELHHWSLHHGGAHFAFVDGHSQFLSYASDIQVLIALSTISGGESPPEM